MIVIKDYNFTETEHTIHISVPIKGVQPNKVDAYCNGLFIKVNFQPFLFQLDLFKPVSILDKDVVVKVGNGLVEFHLKKVEVEKWGKANYNHIEGDISVAERRVKAEKDYFAKLEEMKKDRLALKQENERLLVQKQIQVEREEKLRVENLKLQEKLVAEENLNDWVKSIETPSDQKLPTSAEKIEIFDDDDLNIVETEEEENFVFEEAIRTKSLDYSGSMVETSKDLSEQGNEIRNILDLENVNIDESILDMDNILLKVKKQLEKKPEKKLPPPRGKNVEITFKFTDRGPLPTKVARESEDAKWHARIEEAKLKSIQKQNKPKKILNEENLADNNVMLLKDKAKLLIKQENLEGALNVYTQILDINQTDISALLNKSLLQMKLSKPDDCISTCSIGLKLLIVEENAIKSLEEEGKIDEVKSKELKNELNVKKTKFLVRRANSFLENFNIRFNNKDDKILKKCFEDCLEDFRACYQLNKGDKELELNLKNLEDRFKLIY
ncbi:Dynein assembly factor 4, axonemal [Clydaea vesicula]|uniref:Dynein assembly factor 4, axonemal n=1 Tax=Clydaea vesicula TaxID=447962 RepID=A0AAD5U995_9FUNG|nr:Dynein assembly factor 4, axonemal [Clydaea vesicula]